MIATSRINYQDKFKCGNKRCSGELIPFQLRENKKDNTVRVIGKCPKCGKAYDFPLSRKEVDDWLSILQDQMFKCTECGHPSLKTENVLGSLQSDYKINLECLECKKKNERFVDGGLFFLVQDKLPSAERVVITCPSCGEKIIDDSKKKCPSCGRDIFCSKCGALLPPQAKFCEVCAEPVKLGNTRKKAVSVVSTAPANYAKCVKCGNVLPAGAVFCNACGTPVSIGQKAGAAKPAKSMDPRMAKAKR